MFVFYSKQPLEVLLADGVIADVECPDMAAWESGVRITWVGAEESLSMTGVENPTA